VGGESGGGVCGGGRMGREGGRRTGRPHQAVRARARRPAKPARLAPRAMWRQTPRHPARRANGWPTCAREAGLPSRKEKKTPGGGGGRRPTPPATRAPPPQAGSRSLSLSLDGPRPPHMHGRRRHAPGTCFNTRPSYRHGRPLQLRVQDDGGRGLAGGLAAIARHFFLLQSVLAKKTTVAPLRALAREGSEDARPRAPAAGFSDWCRRLADVCAECVRGVGAARARERGERG